MKPCDSCHHIYYIQQHDHVCEFNRKTQKRQIYIFVDNKILQRSMCFSNIMQKKTYNFYQKYISYPILRNKNMLFHQQISNLYQISEQKCNESHVLNKIPTPKPPCCPPPHKHQKFHRLIPRT